VIDVNDVTERDAFIGAAARGEVPGLGARPCSGRLDRADQPDGRVVPLLSRSCAQSVPDRAAYGIVATVAVPVFSRCAVVVLRPATDFARLCRTSSAR